MKLDPVFTVKQNKLYKIDGNSEVAAASLKRIEIKWSQVELAEESYNEEYLAQLRDELKAMDDAGTFADIEWGNPNASSVSEMIYNLTAKLKTDEDKNLIVKDFWHLNI